MRRSAPLPGLPVLLGALAVLLGSCSTSDPAPRAAAPPAERRPPVVMLAFDEFPSDELLGPDGRIDRVRYPNFAALAGDSTWYPNATTVADWSWRALPAILTGNIPTKRNRESKNRHPRSIFQLLKRNGYDIRGSEEVTSVCPYRGCRSVRERPFDRIVGFGRFERLRRSAQSIRATRRPTFTFHDSILPHQPWVFLPSGLRHQRGTGDFELEVTGPPGFGDRYLTLHSRQRHLLQLGALDRALGGFMRRLRETGVYDRALVVVTADHGIAWDLGVEDRRKVTRDNMDEVAFVPLFIKAPRQPRGAVDYSYIRTVDILPTVADLLGFRLWPVDGSPAGSPSVRRRRIIRLVKRDFSGTVAVPTSKLGLRRVANVLERNRVFGSGAWDSIYRVGPNAEIIGRAPADLPRARARGARAVLLRPERLRAVRRRSGFLPASVSGRVVGGRPGAVRDLAVAVNGRIVAVGRSFHLKGRPGERLAVMVPEKSLREGRNEVDVFAVRPGSPPRLALLASVR